MPDISANSLSIAFGHFQRGYTIVDRNTSMLRDPFTKTPRAVLQHPPGRWRDAGLPRYQADEVRRELKLERLSLPGKRMYCRRVMRPISRPVR